MPERRPLVASYCATFLKPEMLHIYRQITGLRDWQTFVVCQRREQEAKFPFADLEIQQESKCNFARRFWLKYIRNEPPVVYRGEFRRLMDILNRRSPDVLHVYFGHTGVHLLPLIERSHIPTVVSFHGMDVQDRPNQPGYTDTLRTLLQKLPLVLARSGSLKNRLVELGCSEEKIRINNTSIPLDAYPFHAAREFPRDGRWRLVQTCRMIGKKGLDVSLQAFAGFCSHYPESTFTIAGDGPLKAQLQAQAASLGIADRVHFVGFLNEQGLCDLYRQSHAFLHPSQMMEDKNQEGIPNAMLEAMATGLPTLATYHGGIPEVITDNVNGLLIEERANDRLLDNLLRLAREDGLWQKLGVAGSEHVQTHFETRRAISRLESYYSEVLLR